VVPTGGALDEAVAGAEVKEVIGAVWVRVEVDIVVVAISGSGVDVLTMVVSGVNRIARRRESSSGPNTLSRSDTGSLWRASGRSVISISSI